MKSISGLLFAICSVCLLYCRCASADEVDNGNPLAVIDFAQSGDTTFIVHPFMADAGAELVLPAFWSADSILVRCDKI